MQVSPEDFQRYLRSALQLLSGMLISYGLASPNSSWLPTLMGFLTSGGTVVWMLYGNRIQAKINEVAKLTNPDDPSKPLVQDMKVTSVPVAKNAPDNVNPTHDATH